MDINTGKWVLFGEKFKFIHKDVIDFLFSYGVQWKYSVESSNFPGLIDIDI